MANFLGVTRAEMTPALAEITPGTRVCVRGQWHTVRSIGHPILAGDTDISVAFEDGGGAPGRNIDAVRLGDDIVSTYAPGTMPADPEG